MTTITAILPAENTRNARQPDNKELVAAYSLIAKTETGNLLEVVTARFWMGRSRSAMEVKCCVWVHSPDHYYSGKGSAGGGGYCKKSAALDSAIRDAGIQLSRSIHGTGEIREGMRAIAGALGCDLETALIVEH